VDAPPIITVQPWSHTVAAGSNATLSVVAGGTPAPAYQWHFMSVPIPDALEHALTISNFLAANEGEYYVLVSNALGAASSERANLYLNWPLRFLNPNVNCDGPFQARVVGLTNMDTVIDVSPDLSFWISFATNHALSGIIDFTDTNSAEFSNRFYRARLAPGAPASDH
jgi:hypothetical protein